MLFSNFSLIFFQHSWRFLCFQHGQIFNKPWMVSQVKIFYSLSLSYLNLSTFFYNFLVNFYQWKAGLLFPGCFFCIPSVLLIGSVIFPSVGKHLQPTMLSNFHINGKHVIGLKFESMLLLLSSWELFYLFLSFPEFSWSFSFERFFNLLQSFLIFVLHTMSPQN